MLRVHLTAEDLLRTKFASQPAPLIEVGLALAALHRRDPGFGRWRRAAVTGFPVPLRALLELVPASATGPLFLDPITTDLAEGLALVEQTPASFAAEEMRRVYSARSPTPLARMLAERDRETWRDLVRALLLAFRHLLEDDWPQVLSGFRSEVAWRGRLLAELGLQEALTTLHPLVSWNGTVLQIEAPEELDLYPGGTGLMLLPSLFWTGRPMLGEHPDGSAVIIYPALTHIRDAPAVSRRSPAAGDWQSPAQAPSEPTGVPLTMLNLPKQPASRAVPAGPLASKTTVMVGYPLTVPARPEDRDRPTTLPGSRHRSPRPRAR